MQEVRKPRVLVVEDDTTIGALFIALGPEQGVEMVVVPDAETGLARLATESFDLVLTDKNLPGKSGLDVVRAVKRDQPDLDVILMTAYVDINSAIEAFHQGVYDYLQKPFESIEEVMQKIGRALEKRRLGLENKRLIQDLTTANHRIEAMNKGLEAKVLERTQQLQQANARLAEMTLADDVTGLYNQRFLHHRLAEEFQRERRYPSGLSLIMIDLDNFKHANDKHDHLFGSRVLRRIGRMLRHTVRNTDLTVRYGGDEFVIILPHTPLGAATLVAERIRERLARTDVGDGCEQTDMALALPPESPGPNIDVTPIDPPLVAADDRGPAAVSDDDALPEEAAASANVATKALVTPVGTGPDALIGQVTYREPFFVTASLGVASLDATPVKNPNALLQAADKALYAAKQSGRDRVCVMRGERAQLCPKGEARNEDSAPHAREGDSLS